MSNVVIIGAGLSGLYFANKLLRWGIQPLVYDPRAGQYTRPGQLSYSSYEPALKCIDFSLFVSNFEQRKNEIAENKKLYPKLIRAIHHLMTQEGGYEPGKEGQEDAYDLSQKEQSSYSELHIKDIERALYHTARLHGLLRIERKSFAGFATDQPSKGIYVESAEGKEFVPCDYVFDCTGKRAVIHAANQIVPEAPFKLTRISENVRVKNHFIAYIKMPKSDFKLINSFNQKIYLYGQEPEFATKEQYRRGIKLLKPFGWREFAYPRCYGHPFGMKKGVNKVCMYMEAPDFLPEHQQLPWMEAVFNAIIGKPAQYELVAQSKKYDKKPRLSQFTVEPFSLSPYCYEGANLPTVTALGDSQIDSHYFLAQGVKESYRRIDLLAQCLEVSEGKIIYLDTQGYNDEAFSQSGSFLYEIRKHYKERRNYFDASFMRAMSVFNRTNEMIDYLNAEIEDNTVSATLQKSAEQLPGLSIFHQTPSGASLTGEDDESAPVKKQRI